MRFSYEYLGERKYFSNIFLIPVITMMGYTVTCIGHCVREVKDSLN